MKGPDLNDRARNGEDVTPPPFSPPEKERAGPTLPDAARQGLVGEIVGCLEPETEGSSAALLVCFLVGFGAMIGRGPHVVVGSDRHFANLFAVVVGESAKARKTSTYNMVRNRVLKALSGGPEFLRDNVVKGVASGEVLVDLVRDASKEEDKTGKPIRAGVDDKRLLIVETEFGAMLSIAGREGNTLSTQMRDAWDGSRLQAHSRTHGRAVASDPHVSCIGNITSDELREKLGASDTYNGFANRFLWVHARRERSLPEGGARDIEGLAPLIIRLQDNLDEIRRLGYRDIPRSKDATARWRELYEGPFAEEVPGHLGAATNRAEPQTLRLALLYALIDGYDFIDLPHLEAAYALWTYCFESTRMIFAPNSKASKWAEELKRRGEMTATDVSKLFCNNLTKREREILAEQIGAESFTRALPGKTGRPETLFRLRSQPVH